MNQASQTTSLPTVGVVIRTFNSEKYLKEAIESVVNQQYPGIEIVVVDGGSTDQTLDIVRSLAPKARIVRQTTPGLGGAAQNGVDALDTELVAFQDSDDIWTQGRLLPMVESLMSRPDCAAVLGAVEHFLSPELDAVQHGNLLIHEGLQPGFGLPAFLAHRWIFKEVGDFAPGLQYGEYLEFIDRFRAKGLKAEQLQLSCLQRRVHKSNFTQGSELKANMLKTLQMVIARRRHDPSGAQ